MPLSTTNFPQLVTHIVDNQNYSMTNSVLFTNLLPSNIYTQNVLDDGYTVNIGNHKTSFYVGDRNDIVGYGPRYQTHFPLKRLKTAFADAESKPREAHIDATQKKEVDENAKKHHDNKVNDKIPEHREIIDKIPPTLEEEDFEGFKDLLEYADKAAGQKLNPRGVLSYRGDIITPHKFPEEINKDVSDACGFKRNDKKIAMGINGIPESMSPMHMEMLKTYLAHVKHFRYDEHISIWPKVLEMGMAKLEETNKIFDPRGSDFNIEKAKATELANKEANEQLDKSLSSTADQKKDNIKNPSIRFNHQQTTTDTSTKKSRDRKNIKKKMETMRREAEIEKERLSRKMATADPFRYITRYAAALEQQGKGLEKMEKQALADVKAASDINKSGGIVKMQNDLGSSHKDASSILACGRYHADDQKEVKYFWQVLNSGREDEAKKSEKKISREKLPPFLQDLPVREVYRIQNKIAADDASRILSSNFYGGGGSNINHTAVYNQPWVAELFKRADDSKCHTRYFYPWDYRNEIGNPFYDYIKSLVENQTEANCPKECHKPIYQYNKMKRGLFNNEYAKAQAQAEAELVVKEQKNYEKKKQDLKNKGGRRTEVNLESLSQQDDIFKNRRSFHKITTSRLQERADKIIDRTYPKSAEIAQTWDKEGPLEHEEYNKMNSVCNAIKGFESGWTTIYNPENGEVNPGYEKLHRCTRCPLMSTDIIKQRLEAVKIDVPRRVDREGEPIYETTAGFFKKALALKTKYGARELGTKVLLDKSVLNPSGFLDDAKGKNYLNFAKKKPEDIRLSSTSAREGDVLLKIHKISERIVKEDGYEQVRQSLTEGEIVPFRLCMNHLQGAGGESLVEIENRRKSKNDIGGNRVDNWKNAFSPNVGCSNNVDPEEGGCCVEFQVPEEWLRRWTLNLEIQDVALKKKKNKGKAGKVDDAKSIYGSLDPPQKRNEIFTRMLNGFFKPPEPLKHYFRGKDYYTKLSLDRIYHECNPDAGNKDQARRVAEMSDASAVADLQTAYRKKSLEENEKEAKGFLPTPGPYRDNLKPGYCRLRFPVAKELLFNRHFEKRLSLVDSIKNDTKYANQSTWDTLSRKVKDKEHLESAFASEKVREEFSQAVGIDCGRPDAEYKIGNSGIHVVTPSGDVNSIGDLRVELPSKLLHEFTLAKYFNSPCTQSTKSFWELQDTIMKLLNGHTDAAAMDLNYEEAPEKWRKARSMAQGKNTKNENKEFFRLEDEDERSNMIWIRNEDSSGNGRDVTWSDWISESRRHTFDEGSNLHSKGKFGRVAFRKWLLWKRKKDEILADSFRHDRYDHGTLTKLGRQDLHKWERKWENGIFEKNPDIAQAEYAYERIHDNTTLIQAIQEFHEALKPELSKAKKIVDQIKQMNEAAQKANNGMNTTSMIATGKEKKEGTTTTSTISTGRKENLKNNNKHIYFYGDNVTMPDFMRNNPKYEHPETSFAGGEDDAESEPIIDDLDMKGPREKYANLIAISSSKAQLTNVDIKHDGILHILNWLRQLFGPPDSLEAAQREFGRLAEMGRVNARRNRMEQLLKDINKAQSEPPFSSDEDVSFRTRDIIRKLAEVKNGIDVSNNDTQNPRITLESSTLEDLKKVRQELENLIKFMQQKQIGVQNVEKWERQIGEFITEAEEGKPKKESTFLGLSSSSDSTTKTSMFLEEGREEQRSKAIGEHKVAGTSSNIGNIAVGPSSNGAVGPSSNIATGISQSAIDKTTYNRFDFNNMNTPLTKELLGKGVIKQINPKLGIINKKNHKNDHKNHKPDHLHSVISESDFVPFGELINYYYKGDITSKKLGGEKLQKLPGDVLQKLPKRYADHDSLVHRSAFTSPTLELNPDVSGDSILPSPKVAGFAPTQRRNTVTTQPLILSAGDSENNPGDSENEMTHERAPDNKVKAEVEKGNLEEQEREQEQEREREQEREQEREEEREEEEEEKGPSSLNNAGNLFTFKQEEDIQVHKKEATVLDALLKQISRKIEKQKKSNTDRRLKDYNQDTKDSIDDDDVDDDDDDVSMDRDKLQAFYKTDIINSDIDITKMKKRNSKKNKFANLVDTMQDEYKIKNRIKYATGSDEGNFGAFWSGIRQPDWDSILATQKDPKNPDFTQEYKEKVEERLEFPTTFKPEGLMATFLNWSSIKNTNSKNEGPPPGTTPFLSIDYFKDEMFGRVGSHIRRYNDGLIPASEDEDEIGSLVRVQSAPDQEWRYGNLLDTEGNVKFFTDPVVVNKSDDKSDVDIIDAPNPDQNQNLGPNAPLLQHQNYTLTHGRRPYSGAIVRVTPQWVQRVLDVRKKLKQYDPNLKVGGESSSSSSTNNHFHQKPIESRSPSQIETEIMAYALKRLGDGVPIQDLMSDLRKNDIADLTKSTQFYDSSNGPAKSAVLTHKAVLTALKSIGTRKLDEKSNENIGIEKLDEKSNENIGIEKLDEKSAKKIILNKDIVKKAFQKNWNRQEDTKQISDRNKKSIFSGLEYKASRNKKSVFSGLEYEAGDDFMNKLYYGQIISPTWVTMSTNGTWIEDITNPCSFNRRYPENMHRSSEKMDEFRDTPENQEKSKLFHIDPGNNCIWKVRIALNTSKNIRLGHHVETLDIEVPEKYFYVDPPEEKFLNEIKGQYGQEWESMNKTVDNEIFDDERRIIIKDSVCKNMQSFLDEVKLQFPEDDTKKWVKKKISNMLPNIITSITRRGDDENDLEKKDSYIDPVKRDEYNLNCGYEQTKGGKKPKDG